MPDLFVAAMLDILPLAKVKSIQSALHTKSHQKDSHMSNYEYDLLTAAEKAIEKREGKPDKLDARVMLGEALRDMFQNGVD